MKRTFVNLPDHNPALPFSDGVLLDGTLYLSGRIGFDPATGKVPENASDEARYLLEGFVAVLKEADMTMDDLIYVSPKTGRAVSRAAGEPYKDRMLPLPPFLLSSQSRLEAGDVGAGLSLTAHFLEQFIFNPINRPLPPARIWLVDRLSEAGRL